MHLVRFNAFQRVMRVWETLHPYNAAQVMRLAGAPDVGRWEEAWGRTLSDLGLTRVCLHGADAFSFDARAAYTSGPRVETGEDALDKFLSGEMNRRFDEDQGGGCRPFRAFVLRGAGDTESYFAGVVYRHWVADSASIRMLLREWLARALGAPGAGARGARVADRGFWHFFGPDAAHWDLRDGLLGLPRFKTRFARARRLPDWRAERPDLRVRVTFHSLPDGAIDGIVGAAHRLHVTVHDLVLSAIAEACDRHGACPHSPGRDELAIGTVVDLRGLRPPGAGPGDAFGLFLGFTTTMVRAGDLRDWPRLVRIVAAQNAAAKRTRAAEASVLRMGGALLESRFLPPHRWARLYRARMPLAAGVSNVNMNRTWAAAHHPAPLLDYLRVAPTGPTFPLMLTPTTLGKRFGFGLTRRASALGDDQAARFVACLTGRLVKLASGS